MLENVSFQNVALATLLILSVLLFLAFFMAATRRVYPGFKLWITTLVVLGLSPLGVLWFGSEGPLRGWRWFAAWLPAFITPVLAHAGVRQFRGRPVAWRSDFAIVGAGLAGASVSMLLDLSEEWLLVVATAVIATITFRAGSACVRGVRPALRPAYYLFGSIHFLLVAVTLVRVLLVQLDLEPFGASSTLPWGGIGLYFGGAIIVVAWLFGVVLVTGQRQEVEMLDAQQVLREQATTDFLTGLGNRRHFFAEAKERVERPGRPPQSLLLLDLDHFKRINDRFGHDLGDAVLRRVASVLRSVLPEDALCGRIGGEEFVVLVAGDVEQTQRLAQEVLDAIRNRVKKGILRQPVTASAGVAGCRAGESLDETLRRADERLYGAKDAGRGRVVTESEEGGAWDAGVRSRDRT